MITHATCLGELSGASDTEHSFVVYGTFEKAEAYFLGKNDSLLDAPKSEVETIGMYDWKIDSIRPDVSRLEPYSTEACDIHSACMGINIIEEGTGYPMVKTAAPFSISSDGTITWDRYSQDTFNYRSYTY